MLTIDTIPLCDLRIRISDLGLEKSEIPNPNSQIPLFVFSVQRMATATTAELFELKPIRRALFVLRRHVIALLTIGALQNYVVSSAFRHFLPLSFFVIRPWSVETDEGHERMTNTY
jgi:hypothetical protein